MQGLENDLYYSSTGGVAALLESPENGCSISYGDSLFAKEMKKGCSIRDDPATEERSESISVLAIWYGIITKKHS